MTFRIAISIVLLLSGATAVAGQNYDSAPEFLKQLIDGYEDGPSESSPSKVWSYKYRGQFVYYVAPMMCCDIPSIMYDSEGEILCRPEGGFAGVGDGKCQDFIETRSDEKLIWQDTRKGEVR